MTDAITFDLAAALAGQTYPTDTVLVPLDREAAAGIAEHKRLIAKAKRRENPEQALAILEPELDDLIEKARSNSLKVTLTALSRDAARALNLAVNRLAKEGSEDMPTDEYEKYVRNVEVGEQIQAYTWTAYITKIEQTDGSAIEPVELEHGTLLVEGLPNASAEIIDEAIKGLDASATLGYEEVVKDVDFSSAP